MTVFISLVVDDFQKVFQQQVQNSKSGGRRYGAGSPTARRPVRGLEIKDDTYAMIKVIDAGGNEIPLFDSGSKDPNDGKTTKYSNFLLQSVNEARMEKQQIVETFGEAYIFFFGEQPRFLDVTAVLLNSLDFNWHAEWWENYDNYLRGTKLVESGARVYLFYDDIIVEGYMLMAQTGLTQDMPLAATLQFRLFVTNYSNISLTDDDYYPIRAGAVLPAGVDLTSNDGTGALTPTSPTGPTQAQLAASAVTAILQQQGAAQIQQQIQDIQFNQLLTQEEQAAAITALQGSSFGFGGGVTLISTLQQGLSSTAFPAQNIQSFLQNAAAVVQGASQSAFGGVAPDPNLVRTIPLRGRITDNSDEYIGGSPSTSTPSSATDQSPGAFSPVGGNSQDPVGDLNQQALMRGAQLGTSNFYGFGMVPYTPGQGFVTAGAFGRPAGAGGGFSGGSVGQGFSGGGYYPGAGGGALTGSQGSAPGGSAALINNLSQQGFFGGNNGGPRGVGVYPGVGFGFGQGQGPGFSNSYGYTSKVGGAYGGSLGGTFGPGVGGGLGGFGSDSYGNPEFPQSGNPLSQQYVQSPFGLPTGSPFGLGITQSGPNTTSVYAYTAGIGPDGRLQIGTGASAFAGAGPNPGVFGGPGSLGGFGSTTTLSIPIIFDGSATVGAVAAMPMSISGDGVFSLQAVPGDFDPTLMSGGLGVG